jgi:glycosyltransferase involved in cell wall biosynthesis
VTRLLIVQPYIPAYRIAFFRGLRDRLAQDGVVVRIVVGTPDRQDMLRGDDVGRTEADGILRERQLRLGQRTARLRSLRSELRSFDPDLIVLEQAIKNLEIYPLLLRAALTGRGRVAVWGHGRTFSTPQSRVEAEVKQWLTRRSDWFFAYTDESAEYVVQKGFSKDRVTVLDNTNDADELRWQLSAVTPEEIVECRKELGLTEGHTGLFLGGVDERKGVPFLLEAAEEIAMRDPHFVLVVGGTGELAPLVAEAAARKGPVRFLGRLDGREKALMLKATDFVMVPEWVGLVAVDALVSGRPVVTTEHWSHSPEFAYLCPGETSIVVPHEVGHYVDAVLSLMGRTTQLKRMQGNAAHRGESFSLAQMIQRFADGVHRWMDCRSGDKRPHG